jgi:hypothetical protein
LDVPTSRIWVFEQNNAIHNNSIRADWRGSTFGRSGAKDAAACQDQLALSSRVKNVRLYK